MKTYRVEATQIIKRELSCYIKAKNEVEARKKYLKHEIDDWDDIGTDRIVDNEIMSIDEEED